MLLLLANVADASTIFELIHSLWLTVCLSICSYTCAAVSAHFMTLTSISCPGHKLNANPAKIIAHVEKAFCVVGILSANANNSLFFFKESAINLEDTQQNVALMF